MQAFVYARVACREDAEELAQDVMMRIYAHLDDNIQHPDTWVYTVARNAVYDYYRARGRRPDLIRPLVLPDDEDERDPDEWLSRLALDASSSRDIPTPDASLLYAIIDAVEGALANTDDPALKKELLELATDGLADGAIGEAIGVNKRYVSNTLNRLRKHMAPKHPEWAKDRRLRGPKLGTPRARRDGARAEPAKGSSGDPPEPSGSPGDEHNVSDLPS